MGSWAQSPTGSLLSLHTSDTSEDSYTFLHHRCFSNKLNYGIKEIMRIFVEIGHIKNQEVIFWPSRIRLVFPMLWSSHDFGHKI
jgi:hypothetical protein